METMVDSLYEDKLGIIRKSFDKASEDASCILKLTEHLKDLEGNFEMAKESLLKKEQELERREQEVEMKLKEVTERREECNSKIVSAQNEVVSKRGELALVQKEHQECLQDIAAKKKQLGSVMKSIEDYNKKLKAEETKLFYKEKELSKVQKRKEEVSDELNSKEEHLNSIKGMIQDFNARLEDKERRCQALNSSIDKCSYELARKQKLLNSVKVAVMGKNEELEAKRKDLELIDMSIKERSSKLEQEKKKLAAVENYTNELAEKLESKEKYVRLTEQKMQSDYKDQEMKLNAVQRSLKERNEELALKEKELKSIEMSIAERIKELEAMKKQLAQPENLVAACEVNSSTVDYQSCISENGKHLQSLLNESYRKQDLVQKEALNAIQKSADPGKLVLDAMQGFHPADFKEQESDFDLIVIRRSCLTLLEQLLKLSPGIKPEVQDEALKLALEWKSKMKKPCESDLEVSAFLQLLAAFKLSSSFGQDELQSFLDVIYQNRKALQLRRALGFAEGLSGTHLEKIRLLQANQQNSSPAIDPSTFRLINERVCPLILEDKMSSPDLMPHEVISALNYSPDPAKFVLEVMLGSYSQHIKNGGVELDESAAKNEILLMGQLMVRKPVISLSVREGAMKLLALWKENVTRETVNGLEACAFLLFLNIYGLSYYFNMDKILGLLVKVAQLKHAPNFCRVLGFADKIPELIPILLQRKQYNEAVRFICAFGLFHLFSIDTVQKNCVEDIWKSAQDQAIENELNTRKDILQCILEYKLDSVCDTSRIRLRIVDLEAQKASNMALQSIPVASVQPSGSYSGYQPCFGPCFETQLQNRLFEDEQGSNKRLRR